MKTFSGVRQSWAIATDGKPHIVESVEAYRKTNVTVYNLSVAATPNYAVGQHGALVHNAPKCPNGVAPKTPVHNFTVQHSSKKAAKEAAAHAHGGKPRPTPPKSDVAKRKAYEEQQKYRKPESHPNSDHPESHFHDSNKTTQKERHRKNAHHSYPQ